ncbi:MAG: multidrug resistance efflux transporter family protein [Bacillota bacterium]|nr:multidrug resistance efflux transporter family protein [Bacillota bacterium]
MKKAILFGTAASFFFAAAFIFNRKMNLSGGSWIWSGVLRYAFMLVILSVIVTLKNEAGPVMKDILQKPVQWIIWSTVGFGLFYASLCLSSVYGAAWLTAGTWQITIIAGAILSPLFYKIVESEGGTLKIRNRVPKKSLLMSSIILVGVFLIQYQQAVNVSLEQALKGVIWVILAAFAYPLGNRKMMEVCDGKFNSFQRVFGMTLCSMPFWFILSVFGIVQVGLPGKGQIVQALIVAISSGVVATILFFKATSLVRDDVHKLAIVESTQAGEVIFTLIGGMLLLNDSLPSFVGCVGMIFVIVGMILNSLISADT